MNNKNNKNYKKKNTFPLNLRLTTYIFSIILIKILYCYIILLCSTFSQGIRVWRIGYGALCGRTAIELIVADKVVHIHRKNRFGIELLTVVRQVKVMFPGQVIDVVRLQVRPVFHHVHLILYDKRR